MSTPPKSFTSELPYKFGRVYMPASLLNTYLGLRTCSTSRFTLHEHVRVVQSDAHRVKARTECVSLSVHVVISLHIYSSTVLIACICICSVRQCIASPSKKCAPVCSALRLWNRNPCSYVSFLLLTSPNPCSKLYTAGLFLNTQFHSRHGFAYL